MSQSSTLREILRDGKAGYTSYTTHINMPPDLLLSLGKRALAFAMARVPDFGEPGKADLTDLVPATWEPVERKFFFGLPGEDQLAIMGLFTCVIHECLHHFDLLRTPFGASFHEKMCREFMAFERAVPELIDHGGDLLNKPLADWAVSNAPGEPTQRLLSGSPLDRALFDLCGPIAFDEVRRGTPPRYVSDGWPLSTATTLKLRGERRYKQVTVNWLWPSIETTRKGQYLSPNEVIEGRTFAICVIYLLELLGFTRESIAAVRRYVDHFYSSAPKYLTLLELHAGMSADQLWDETEDTIYVRLWETALNGWYALHAPPPVETQGMAHSMVARSLMLAKSYIEAPLRTFPTASACLAALDDRFTSADYLPAAEALKVSAERLTLTLGLNGTCRDPVVRDWYDVLLTRIRDDLVTREKTGYELRTGMPPDGNPLRGVDEATFKMWDFPAAPDRVVDWFELRTELVQKAPSAENKIRSLRSFFAYMLDNDQGSLETMQPHRPNLGLLRQMEGDLAGAAGAYQLAIDCGDAGHAPSAAFNLGALRQEEGDLAGAAEAYQLAIDSGHAEYAPSAAFNLGLLRKEQGDLAAAAEAYQLAIDSGHAEAAPRAAVTLGLLRKEQGHLAEAAAAWQRAIDSGHAEHAPSAAFDLGLLRHEQGDLARAAAAYQLAIDSGHAEHAPKAAVNLGLLRQEQGDLAGAASRLPAGHRLRPG